MTARGYLSTAPGQVPSAFTAFTALTAMAAQASALALLPRELLDSVVRFLPTLDFNNLRLTCKQIENAIFPYWANCFFRTRQFMIDDASLNTLLLIARHPVLSKHLTHLAIGLDDLRTVNVHTLRDLDEAHQHRDALESQQCLLSTGEAASLLSAAIATLPNLQYIDIRDYCSRTRYRDGGYWISYGSSVYAKWYSRNGAGDMHHTGHRLIRCQEDFASNVFKTIIAALKRVSRTAKSPVRRLDLITKQHTVLKDDAFALVRAPDTAFLATLGNLTTLHLTLAISVSEYIETYQINPLVQMHNNELISARGPVRVYDFHTKNLRNFLTFTPNLTWLRLNNDGGRGAFIGRNARGPAIAFFNWLALQPEDIERTTKYTERIASPLDPITLPLQRLELNNWELPAQTWTSLLQKHCHLQHLALSHATIIPDSPGTRISLKGQEKKPLWADIFRALPVLAPKMKYIQLDKLAENDIPSSNGSKDPVLFLDTRTRKEIRLPIDGEKIPPPIDRVTRVIASKDDLNAIPDSMILHSVYLQMMTEINTDAYLDGQVVESGDETGEDM